MNTNISDKLLAQEAIAMMENGRPTPLSEKRLLIEGLTRNWKATYIHFGTKTQDDLPSPEPTH